ncbi:DUF1254 domain-containing protein [Legionella donaldsonii]|uniref:DUF1254 domain-containing protein n=1 Tax=Legionella donaldsonii TaxID=45060 RepID=UPI00399CC2F3
MIGKPCVWKLGTLVFLIFYPLTWANSASLSAFEALQLGTEAYIYGYPLVTMDLTKRVMTNAVKPNNGRGPMGQFINIRRFPDASFKDIPAPNADTLYSFAWLDLGKEPYLLHVPNQNGRYYIMPLLSGWTEVFAAPGSRTTGTEAHDFVIVGPNWKGTVPEGVVELKSPTNMVWILGRTYCTGTAEDYHLVHSVQDKYSVKPLSYYGKAYTPPTGIVDPAIDMKTPIRQQVNAMDAATYFKQLAILLKDNPPASSDAPMVEKLAKIGIVAGQEFDLAKLDPAVAMALENAVKAGQYEILMQKLKAAKELRNGWVVTTRTGIYGTDYKQRALLTAAGLGANRPQDAIYPVAMTDKSGQTLHGANQYLIHFDPDETPPVNGFWSLTMYDERLFFVANPLNRYTVSPRNNLNYNQDGSLDLYIQHQSPGKDKESNWLPAPEGTFILMFRFYWPKPAIIDGQWQLPAVKRIESAGIQN